MIFFVPMWQTILTAVLALLTAGYAGLILYYRRLFTRLKPVSPATGTAATRFSIIIPARNEEESIGRCLSSLFSQDYPAELFQVIVVDDHSTDGTASVVSRLKDNHPNLALIRLA
jgi:cellulose synthase/poly-beta-1,6-N-acetylglucosamine synthase-like glycosyltransferase